jgi:glycine hydroxymethyltransferase
MSKNRLPYKKHWVLRYHYQVSPAAPIGDERGKALEAQLRPWLSADEVARIDTLLEAFQEVEPGLVFERVSDLVQRSNTLFDHESINLYAGTNVMDPQACALLSSTLGSRPSLGYPGNKYEMGLQDAEAIEVLCLSLARRLFKCPYVEFRVHSGSLANLYTYMSLTKPGDTLFALPTYAAAHATHREQGAAGLYGLRIVDIPWDDMQMMVDLDQLADLAQRERPRIILIGGSLVLYPYPLREIRAIADEIGAYVVYDAAHVSGLVAAGTFQQPLQEGAHVVTMSTYKSLGGPPGGLILTADPNIAQRLERIAYPGLTANFDLSRIAALTVALAGFLQFGADYATAMRANARALAEALASEGMQVVGHTHNYTESHHVAIAVQEYGGGDRAARTLEESLIFASGIGIPGPATPGEYNGLRFGTQEVTRWGMEPPDMAFIASAIADCLCRRRSIGEVRRDVQAFRGQFQRLHFVLDENSSD